MMMMKKSIRLFHPTVRFSSQRWHQKVHRRQMSRTATSPYKAVIFDMYGVLLPSPVKLASVFEQQSGVPLGTLGRAIRAGGEGNVWRSFMTGKLGALEFVEAFSKQCSEIAGCPVPIGSFLSALTSGPMKEPLPVMMEVIKCVRSRGLKTAVLSNNFLTVDGKPFMPLDAAYFDVIVESCREGLSKPDGRIYQLCLDRLGVSAQHAVFLDDLQFNVQAASDLGLTAIKVEDPAAAVRDLEEVLGFPLSSGASLPHMDQLTQYLRTRLHLDNTDVVSVHPLEPSQSLYFLNCRGRHLLLRTQQPGSQALETEHRVLKALSGSGLPLPQIVDYSEDPSLGGRFLLMEVCPGRMFLDPSLPGVAPADRTELYQAMTRTLCQLHSLHTTQLHLEDHVVPVQSLGLQVESWTQQYRASQTKSIPAMDRLINWLPLHLPKHNSSTLVHGDFRMSKLVFHPERPEVLGVLDWGSAAMGDPLLDLTSSCIAQHLPRDHPLLPGLGGLDLDQQGIPGTEDLIGRYCSSMGVEPPAHWQFYMALQLFRLAVLQQEAEQLTEPLAEMAWDFATKEGFRIFNTMPRGRALN